MIFSHVLYQLSYLAEKKPGLRRLGLVAWATRACLGQHPRSAYAGSPAWVVRLSAPCHRTYFEQRSAAKGDARIAGAGFEPATFGL